MNERKTSKLHLPTTLSRRKFLQIAGLTGTAVAVQACAPQPTLAPTPTVTSQKPGLAAGKIGGPTGFEGAERYQYGPDDPAGRAMEGLLSLPEDRRPSKIVVMLPNGAVGHFDVPFPEDAPTVREVFTEESGIELEIVGVADTEQFTKIVQDTTTSAGDFDIYSFWGPDKGSLVEAGAFANLDEYVETYKPEWHKYYAGGELAVQQYNVYAGSYYVVGFDGDYQIWMYRKDLFEDPNEQAAFLDRYGWELQWPETWEQLDQISEFFTRPDQNLLGNTSLRNPGWGFTNWYQRYASGANPNQLYFDLETGKPLINSDAGIRATEEYAQTLAYHHPDAMTWGWPEQYANMAAGGAAITCAFPNMSKFLDSPDNPDSVVVGKLASGLSPGRIHNGNALIRRTVWWPNITLAVSSQSEYPEAAYLTLQWLNAIYSWMVGNPAGYFDPFQESDFEDPIVVDSYHPYQIETYRKSIEHAVPPILLNGINEYINALDEHLQAVMVGQETAAEAMEATAAEWESITDRLGRDRQLEAIQAQAEAFPTVVDEPTIES